MKNKLKKIMLAISVISLFEPTLFVKIQLINNIYIISAVFLFIILIVKKIKYFKIDGIFLLLFFIRFQLMVMTILNNGDILKTGYITIIIFNIYLLFYDAYQNNYLNEVLNIFSNIVTVYLLVNFISYILNPNGYIDGIYFLGYRTRITEYCVALLFSLKVKKTRRIKKILGYAICLINMFVFNVSTAYVGIITFILVSILPDKIKYKKFFYISTVIAILITFFNIQNLFSFLIVNILHKGLTLTGRTILWEKAIEIIKNGNLLLGNGMRLDGNFIPYAGILWQGHNQLIQCLYETGLVGTLTFYYLIYKIYPVTKSKINKIICNIIFSIQIMMITEIYSYYAPFYFVIIASYFIEKRYEIEN